MMVMMSRVGHEVGRHGAGLTGLEEVLLSNRKVGRIGVVLGRGSVRLVVTDLRLECIQSSKVVSKSIWEETVGDTSPPEDVEICGNFSSRTAVRGDKFPQLF